MLDDIVDFRTLVSVNLVIQTVLIAAVSVAAYFAKRRQLQVHCRILRVAVPLQALSFLSIMLPAMMGYFPLGERGLLLAIEIPVHVFLGLMVILLWTYVNLVVKGAVRSWGRLANTMRLAFASWLICSFIGVHEYLAQYL